MSHCQWRDIDQDQKKLQSFDLLWGDVTRTEARTSNRIRTWSAGVKCQIASARHRLLIELLTYS